jgi:hypothetical protein
MTAVSTRSIGSPSRSGDTCLAAYAARWTGAAFLRLDACHLTKSVERKLRRANGVSVEMLKDLCSALRVSSEVVVP